MTPRTLAFAKMLSLACVVLAFAWVAVAPCSAGAAEIPGASFESANKLYEEGKFAEAAAAYTELLHSGKTSAALFFNLGNAYFKSGQLGRAIAAYRQAEQITPRDPDVRANLQFARNQRQGPSLPPQPWQRWLGKLSLNEWTWLAAAAVWLWLILLALLQWRPALKRPLRGTVIAAALVAAALSACLGLLSYQAHKVHTAVVITPESTVRHGPLEESQNAFTVHDGAELRVLDQKDDWLQVSTDPRAIGWLRRNEVLLLPRS